MVKHSPRILPGPFGVLAPHGWTTALPQLLEVADTLEHPTRSPLEVLENGRPLGPAHALHRDIAILGEGRYSHWNDLLLFSTSDNSDPGRNGRQYAVRLKRAKPPTLFGIGSCRIYTPLSILAARERIAIGHEGVDWYTHCSKEAIQKIRVLRGEMPLPSDHEFMFVYPGQSCDRSRFLPGFFDDMDALVVEVSSIKELHYGVHVFQQWCLREQLIKEGIDHEEFLRYLRGRAAGSLENPYDAGDADAFLRRRASSIRLIEQSAATLVEDLLAICDMVPLPVVFAGPINVPANDGKTLKDRRLIDEALREVAARDRAAIFQPGPLCEAAGRENALIDIGHYRDAFYPVIADHLWSAIESALERPVL